MTSILTAAQVEAIRARAEAATPSHLLVWEASKRDAWAFYESARTDIPALIASLTAAREALREVIGHLEIAAVMSEAIGKAYAPPWGADFMVRARAALGEENANV